MQADSDPHDVLACGVHAAGRTPQLPKQKVTRILSKAILLEDSVSGNRLLDNLLYHLQTCIYSTEKRVSMLCCQFLHLIHSMKGFAQQGL